jgi:type III secretion protein J
MPLFRTPCPRWIGVASVLILLSGCSSKLELYSGVTEREANQMLALLLRAGISAEKTTGKTGATISVDSARVPQAVALLNAEGLPRTQYANMGELFGKQGLISSPSEERVRYIYGITQELSRTLSMIDGVLNARVHVVLPGNSPTESSANPSSAAVLIRYAPSTPIDIQVPKIKELVTNSIEGLAYDHVSVVLVKAEPQEVPLDLTGRVAVPPEQPVPLTVLGLGGIGLLSLIGNAALAFLLLRRKAPASASAGSGANVPAVA